MTSPALLDGANNYVHLRAIDKAGNASSGVTASAAAK